MNLIFKKLKIFNYFYYLKTINLLLANKKPFEDFSLSNIRDLFERDYNLVKFFNKRFLDFQQKGFRIQVPYQSYVQIMLEFRLTNIFFSSNFLGKCILCRSLGYKKKRNLNKKLINKKRKLNFVSFKECCQSFIADLSLKLNKLELKNQKAILFLKGSPLPGQFIYFFRLLNKSLKNQNLLQFTFFENVNPLLFKSGLREKKIRRT